MNKPKPVIIMFVAICILLVTAIGLMMVRSLIPSRTNQTVIPQAKPVIAWLESSKTSDLDLFKTVWSSRMIEIRIPPENNDERWKELLEGYKQSWSEEFGEYVISDFVFTYEGDDSEGEVVIEFKGKKYGGLSVIKEDDEWKVNER